jgi:hypothetical protein
VFQAPQQPVIVQLVEPPVHQTSLADVILGALGVVGVSVLCAALLGLLLAGGIILFRRARHRDGIDFDHEAEALRVTPELTTFRK